MGCMNSKPAVDGYAAASPNGKQSDEPNHSAPTRLEQDLTKQKEQSKVQELPGDAGPQQQQQQQQQGTEAKANSLLDATHSGEEHALTKSGSFKDRAFRKSGSLKEGQQDSQKPPLPPLAADLGAISISGLSKGRRPSSSAASVDDDRSSITSCSSPSKSVRSVKFAEDSKPPPAVMTLPASSSTSIRQRRLPQRNTSRNRLGSSSFSNGTMGSGGSGLGGDNNSLFQHQVEVLRSNRSSKLRERRGGLNTNFTTMQKDLVTNGPIMETVNTRAAGLKHIGFGPFKRENQDEFFIQVGDFGGARNCNLFCVFDGHGSHGKDAAAYSRQTLPRLLDAEMTKYFGRVANPEDGIKGAVEVLLSEVFGETERTLTKAGVNLASSGTTASVTYQRGNQVWVAAVGDSRVILCSRMSQGWRALPLTIDHRPRRPSERERVMAAGGRVAPKRLPSGRTVGEPRLWLQDLPSPGLLLSRSLGDLKAATVGCTSDPEVTYVTLRPVVDQFLVMASDGVWDVLTNEQVCDIVVESPDPHIACRRVLDAALYEWEERMSADNVTVLVVEFDWGSSTGDGESNVEQSGGSLDSGSAADAAQGPDPVATMAVASATAGQLSPAGPEARVGAAKGPATTNMVQSLAADPTRT